MKCPTQIDLIRFIHKNGREAAENEERYNLVICRYALWLCWFERRAKTSNASRAIQVDWQRSCRWEWGNEAVEQTNCEELSERKGRKKWNKVEPIDCEELWKGWQPAAEAEAANGTAHGSSLHPLHWVFNSSQATIAPPRKRQINKAAGSYVRSWIRNIRLTR